MPPSMASELTKRKAELKTALHSELDKVTHSLDLSGKSHLLSDHYLGDVLKFNQRKP